MISTIDRVGSRLLFRFSLASSADLDRLAKLIKRYSGSLTPQGVLSLRLAMEDGRRILTETIDILKELYGYTIMD